jgi:hypothetical protein
VRRRLVVILIAAASAFPGPAHAGFWNWGHNYLGNSSDNGLCPDYLPHPGSVCSGWNYWYLNYMHKHAGGYIAWGWVNDVQTGTWIDNGYVEFYSAPDNFGMGGYIKSLAMYESHAASYLQTQAWA